jgi:hypothetical protein
MVNLRLFAKPGNFSIVRSWDRVWGRWHRRENEDIIRDHRCGRVEETETVDRGDTYGP